MTLISMLFLQGMAMANNQITGTLTDGNDGSELVAATVILLDGEGERQLQGVTTDTRGRFVLNGVADGDYLLRFSYIGYEPQSLVLTNLTENIDLGEIALLPSSMELGEVVVSGDRVIRRIDRQTVLPTEAQKKASTNGIALLSRLSLANLTVHPLDKSVTNGEGDAVQLRINGVEATNEEVTALRPADILRIEYHDNPGLRFGNVAAVLDFIVRHRDAGGNVYADLTNGVKPLGFGNYHLSGKYHTGKSAFSAVARWSRRDLEWNRENTETFRHPDHTVVNEETGLPTEIKYDYLTLNLNYAYTNGEKSLLNIALRNNLNDIPHSFTDRNSLLRRDGKEYTLTDRERTRTFIPSLDIYYRLDLKNDRQLYFDVVGTYLESSGSRTYRLEESGQPPVEIRSRTEGDKYSLIGEGIYECPLLGGKFTTGVKHTQAYLYNIYDGDARNTVSMNTAETYLFAELQTGIGRWDCTVGVGAMRTFHRQGGNGQEKYFFRPTLTLSRRLADKVFLRYHAYLSGYAPSLSALSDVTQGMDAFQVRRGNPALRSVTFFSNSLSMSWKTGWTDVELSGRYSYDDKPIMEETLYEGGMFVRTYANQRSFHRLNLHGRIQLRPLKEHLTVSLSPFFNRYVSRGNAYTHTHSNFGFTGSVVGMFGNWVMMAEMYTSRHELWGETISKDEAVHTIAVGYNRERWSVQAMVMNPFTDDYKTEVLDVSRLAPNRQLAYSKDFTRMLMLNVSFNLDFGKQRRSEGRRIQNEDTDTGILSGRK